MIFLHRGAFASPMRIKCSYDIYATCGRMIDISTSRPPKKLNKIAAPLKTMPTIFFALCSRCDSPQAERTAPVTPHTIPASENSPPAQRRNINIPWLGIKTRSASPKIGSDCAAKNEAYANHAK